MEEIVIISRNVKFSNIELSRFRICCSQVRLKPKAFGSENCNLSITLYCVLDVFLTKSSSRTEDIILGK